MFSNSYGLTNPARKKARFLGGSGTYKGFSYQRIGKDEINVERRRKSSKVRLFIKRKKWALRLPRVRVSPLVSIIRRARECYTTLSEAISKKPVIFYSPEWGIPNFYQPYYL
ncbi:hypothetical protein SUGI_0342980 [Cryptomeria japonica]|nr:hypothetical protein SUGI_0342980 [Cryptomeria japonica]